MTAPFAANPTTACNALWIGWFASWWLAAFWSSRAASRVSHSDQLLYRLITTAGFILLFGVNLTRSYHGPLRLWSLPDGAGWVMTALCLAGFVFAWWARLHLGRLWSAFVTRKADHRIIDTGPYAIVRHPIYTGIILSALALASVKGNVYSFAGIALLILGFWIKARLEETFLREQLGAAAYDNYCHRVPMLVPFARSLRNAPK